MTVDLTFLGAVAVAGIAYLVGESTANGIGVLRRFNVPAPIVGGLLFAFLIWGLGAAGLEILVPRKGPPVDFLIALLTTNMGLHLTPQVLGRGLPLFLVFHLAGVTLFFIQLMLVLPIAWQSATVLPEAILAGPLSFVGAPYNLNPPDQVAPVDNLLTPAAVSPTERAQAMMMLGVLFAAVAAPLVSELLLKWAGEKSPSKPAEDRQPPRVSLVQFADRTTTIIILVLAVVAVSFLVQSLLMVAIPSLKQDYLPVIVISYLLGGIFRLMFELVCTRFGAHFPENELMVVLIGPTMGIVLTYAVMSVPLERIEVLHAADYLAAGLAVLGSLAMAVTLFFVLVRLTSRYYAATIATVFLAVTTAWGPVAMSFLRRFTDLRGSIEPMPAVLPLNAFYLFPWMVIGLTKLLFWLAG